VLGKFNRLIRVLGRTGRKGRGGRERLPLNSRTRGGEERGRVSDYAPGESHRTRPASAEGTLDQTMGEHAHLPLGLPREGGENALFKSTTGGVTLRRLVLEADAGANPPESRFSISIE